MKVVPMGFVAIDETKVGRKILREAWPSVYILCSFEAFTDQVVQRLRLDYPKVESVVLAGRVDPANPDFVAKAAKLRALLEQHVTWRVATLFWHEHAPHKHSLMKMAVAQRLFLRQCEGASIGWVAADTMVATSTPLGPCPPGIRQLASNGSMQEVAILTSTDARPDLKLLLVDGSPAVDNPVAWSPFPLSSPRASCPSDQHVGSLKARRSAQGEAWRLPLSCYELASQIRDHKGLRWLTVDEQLHFLGFCSGHLQVAAKFCSRKTFQDEARNLLANAASAIALGIFFSMMLSRCGSAPVVPGLWQSWQELQSSALGAQSSNTWRQRFAKGAAGADEHLRAGARLVQHSARGASHRGSEVRLSTGTLFSPPSMSWITFDPSLWTWEVLQAYSWREPRQSHITYLELLALLNLLRRLGKRTGTAGYQGIASFGFSGRARLFVQGSIILSGPQSHSASHSCFVGCRSFSNAVGLGSYPGQSS